MIACAVVYSSVQVRTTGRVGLIPPARWMLLPVACSYTTTVVVIVIIIIIIIIIISANSCP